MKKALCIKAVPILLGIGIILIFAGLCGIKGVTGLTEKQRLSDFDNICGIIEETSLQLSDYEAVYGIDYESSKSNCREKILSCSNDYEFYCVIKEFLNGIPSIHTTVQFPETQLHGYNDEELLAQSGFISRSAEFWEHELKNNVQKYSDAEYFPFYYVDGNYYSYGTENELFCIDEINGIGADEYITDNAAGCKIMFDGINRKSCKPLIVFNDRYGEKVRITGVDENNDPISQYAFYSSYSETAWYYLNPAETGESSDSIKIYKDIGNDMVYLEIADLKNTNTSEEQKINIRDALEMKNVIIDLRYCSGGSIEYFFENILLPLITDDLIINESFDFPLNEFTEYFFEKYSDDVVLNDDKTIGSYKSEYYVQGQANAEHKIYVLINNGTMSAADQAAYIFKKYKIGTLIGENTGGEGRTGSYMSAVLPDSGLILTYNIGMCNDGDEDEKTILGTFPDVYVNYSVDSYVEKMRLKKYEGSDTEEFKNRLKWDNVLAEAIETAQRDLKVLRE